MHNLLILTTCSMKKWKSKGVALIEDWIFSTLQMVWKVYLSIFASISVLQVAHFWTQCSIKWAMLPKYCHLSVEFAITLTFSYCINIQEVCPFTFLQNLHIFQWRLKELFYFRTTRSHHIQIQSFKLKRSSNLFLYIH